MEYVRLNFEFDIFPNYFFILESLKSMSSSKYDLTAIICHFGSVGGKWREIKRMQNKFFA